MVQEVCPWFPECKEEIINRHDCLLCIGKFLKVSWAYVVELREWMMIHSAGSRAGTEDIKLKILPHRLTLTPTLLVASQLWLGGSIWVANTR